MSARPEFAFAHSPASGGSTASQPAVQGPETDHEGVLEIVHEDTAHGSTYHYNFYSQGTRYSLQFAGRAPQHLLTGARLRVRGVKSGATLAVGGDATNVQQLAPAVNANILGERRLLLILVNFADAAVEPYTPEYARGVMFGTTSQFFMENSSQQAWLGGDVAGWFTIATASAVCDMGAITTQAEAAASAAGFDVTAYQHLVYAFPQNDACLFWGRSTVGGSPSQAWINGEFELGVTAHELGHGFGLFHSHAMDCDTVAVGGANCVTHDYGDNVDMMGGSSRYAHYNAFQKERLGWLNAGASPPITSVQANGTYTLEAYALAGYGPKALKILKSVDRTTGLRTWYYVQARQATGFDAGLASDNFLLPGNILNGLLIHFVTELEGGGNSYLLDMTPASESTYLDWRDPALTVGQTFTDSAAGVSVTTDSVTPTEARVTVRFVDNGNPNSPAILTVKTNQPSYSTGQTVTMSATVKASNGSAVAKASVSFVVTKSNGNVVSGNATSDSNGIASYKLRLKPQDPRGNYVVDAAVTKVTPPPKANASFVVQ